jgi:hypothetical protein
MNRSRVARIAVGSAALAAATVASPALPVQAAAGSAGWHVVHRFGPRISYSVYTSVAVSGLHAWAVGGYGVAGNGLPTAAYFNRGRWSRSPVPGTPTYIGSIAAVSADGPSDAWAVSPGAVLHWHTGRWAIAKRWNLSGGPPGPYKSGITALSPGNVWVFGGSSFGNGTWHLHGRKWSRITGVGRDIFMASALSARDMWAIGGAGANSILHYTGSWRIVTSSSLKALQFGTIFASSAASVWVTASPTGKTGLRLLHLHGTRWTAYALPWSLPLSAVDQGGLPRGGLSPDGHGGFWLSAFSSSSNWLLHFSSSGKWSRVLMGGEVVRSIVRVPAAAAMWAAGSIPQSRVMYPYTRAVIWAHGPTG